MCKIVGYTRVPCKSQLDNNSIEKQKMQILSIYIDAIIYSEEFTAATMPGPIFKEVERNLNTGDTLVISKLDRLASTLPEAIELIQGLINKGVLVHMLNVGLLGNNIMGKFFLTTLSAVNEMKKNTINERIQNGKLITNIRQGLKKGRPRVYTQKQLDIAMELIKTKSYLKVSQITHMSMSTLFRESKKRRERR